jgi:hypothetical protein
MEPNITIIEGRVGKNLCRYGSKTSCGAGAYIVGTDMVPGTYRNSGGRNCYWEG